MSSRTTNALLFLALVSVLWLGAGEPGALWPPEGGARWICPVYGVIAGLAFATGNLIALASTLLSAHLSGCI